MPSYKLYKVQKNPRLEKIISVRELEDFEAPKGVSENISRKIDEIKSNIRKISFSVNNNLKSGENIVFDFEYKLKFNKQDVWIPQRLDLIRFGNLLLIQKVSSDFNLLIANFLYQHITPITFPKKDLLKLWQKMEKTTKKQNKTITLHRIIIQNSYLGADEVRELNISSKDVSELEYFESLTQNARRIHVITVRIKGLDSHTKKALTARIANQDIHIYGTPALSTIINFLHYFS